MADKEKKKNEALQEHMELAPAKASKKLQEKKERCQSLPRR
jgi:hypothetical protein